MLYNSKTTTNSETITIYAQITDSRGRTATKMQFISVYNYSPPTITSIIAYRCNKELDGSYKRDDANGIYVYIKAVFGVSMSGLNVAKATAKLLDEKGTLLKTYNIPKSNAGYVFNTYTLAPDMSYTVE